MIKGFFRALMGLAALTASAAADPWEVTGVAEGDTLNLRSGPSTRFGVVGRLYPGTSGFFKEVCVLVKPRPDAPRSEARSEWCAISDGGGILGWVNARYLAPERPFAAPEPHYGEGWTEKGMEKRGLDFFAAYPGAPGCFLAGETDLTALYLEDHADLVACEPGGMGHFQMSFWHDAMDRIEGYDLFSVPRDFPLRGF